jgi:hypothetical protein
VFATTEDHSAHFGDGHGNIREPERVSSKCNEGPPVFSLLCWHYWSMPANFFLKCRTRHVTRCSCPTVQGGRRPQAGAVHRLWQRIVRLIHRGTDCRNPSSRRGGHVELLHYTRKCVFHYRRNFGERSSSLSHRRQLSRAQRCESPTLMLHNLIQFVFS